MDISFFNHVYSFWPFFTLLHIESYTIPIIQRPMTIHLYGRVMDEYLAAFIFFNEAVSFPVVEPFYFTLFPDIRPFLPRCQKQV